MDTTYNEQIQEVLEIVEQPTKDNEDSVTLSTGAVLGRKEFSPLRIQAILEKFPDPEIPLVMNKEKGRMERNPLDPKYAKMLEQVNNQRGMAMIDVIVASGTEILKVPDNLPDPYKDNDWIEELELGHTTVNRESKIARKFAWIKYVAAKKPEDLEALAEFATKQLGAAEANVANQLQENFPDN